MARLGILTIGQSPRVDLTPELQQWLPGVELVDLGALDGLTHQEVDSLAPAAGEESLITRLADGSAAIIGGDQILPLLQQCIQNLETSVDAVLLACTGHFPNFDHVNPLITPDQVITYGLAALAQEFSHIGVVCPLPEQEQYSVAKFQPHLRPGTAILTTSASPYTDSRETLSAAAAQLAANGAKIIALDCMGYTSSMRRTAASASGVPVVLARSIAARLSLELLDGLPARAEQNGRKPDDKQGRSGEQDLRETIP